MAEYAHLITVWLGRCKCQLGLLMVKIVSFLMGKKKGFSRNKN